MAGQTVQDVRGLVDEVYREESRRVYATLLDKWLNVDSTQVLNNRFEPVAFL